jgi:D-aminoacyl-tRNA deacylase
MIAIIISALDKASFNIKNWLLKLADWKEEKDYWLSSQEDLLIFTIQDYHLYHDNLDLELERKLGLRPEKIIFASKHESASKLPTLTVHPIGNFGNAELGGKTKELVPVDSKLMTNALRLLATKAKEKSLDYRISFEVTHHGPFLSTKSFFIEIGSEENAWQDLRAGEIIASTILELKNKNIVNNPIAIGIGGSHYAPRFTELALSKKIDFAHLVPGYQVGYLDDELIAKLIESSSPELVYFHRKTLSKELYRKLQNSFAVRGLSSIREKELKPL